MRPKKSGIHLSASLELDINAALDHFASIFLVPYHPGFVEKH